MISLRNYRKRENLTLDELAATLGVSTASLSRIETGDQWPDRIFFERLLQITGGEVSADSFLGAASHNKGAKKQRAAAMRAGRGARIMLDVPQDLLGRFESIPERERPQVLEQALVHAIDAAEKRKAFTAFLKRAAATKPVKSKSGAVALLQRVRAVPAPARKG